MRRAVLGVLCLALIVGPALPAGAGPRTRVERVDAVFAPRPDAR